MMTEEIQEKIFVSTVNIIRYDGVYIDFIALMHHPETVKRVYQSSIVFFLLLFTTEVYFQFD